MSYALCIAEKPSVARDIANVIGAKERKNGYFEGGGYLVTWAVGHLVGLAEPDEYGFIPQNQIFSELKSKAYDELPLIPENFRLIVLEATKEQFRIVYDLMHRNDVDYIIDCGDMGPEGHILQWFIRQKADCTKPVKRFCATSMTEEAIKQAMSKLRPIEDFSNIIKGEFCKKKADWILGMSLSRAESIKYGAGINVGRVQSPTLYFIVKRYLEVTNFKVTNYYTMKADLIEGFSVFWNKDTDNIIPVKLKDSESRVLDKRIIDDTVQDVVKAGNGVITELNTVKRGVDRPQLYDITELQRDANRKYGYTAAVTLANAQALYENFKVLTYPRTDSRYITSDLQPYLKDRIKGIGTLDKYRTAVSELLSKGLNVDKKIVDDSKVTDHHALIPTEKVSHFDIEKLIPTSEESKKGVTSETLKNILDLVLCRMIVSFSTSYIYEQTSLTVKFPNAFSFTASGSKPISLGWKAVQESLSDKDQFDDDMANTPKDEEQIFPNISKGQTVNIKNCLNVPKKTTPPKLHTEATLLTAMENAGTMIDNGAILKGKGIGTQATRAEIIKKLFDTEVVEGDKKGKTIYIKPTSKGLSVIRVLPEELYSPKITADWETQIAAIAEGTSTESVFMDLFIEFIRRKVQEVKDATTSVSFRKEREVVAMCPMCGAEVYAFVSKNDKGKIDFIRYYCAKKCGFNLQTNDNIFLTRLKRSISEAEAKKFMHNKFIALDCIRNGNDGKDGTYKAEFTFTKKDYKDKHYCFINCEPVKKIFKK